MRRDPKALLWDARRAAEAVATMLAGKSFDQFDADIVLHSAVERQFEIIGEALGQLARTDAKTAALIPNLPRSSRSAILIHGYALINRSRVWEIVRDDLPGLRAKLAELLPPD